MPQSTQNTIQKHNDQFRSGDIKIPGQIVITAALAAHINEQKELTQSDLATQIQQFSDFTKDNDPHGEHDFGTFQFAGETCYWKIDLYNLEMTAYTEDPTDLKKTFRVLTIMLAQDY